MEGGRACSESSASREGTNGTDDGAGHKAGLTSENDMKQYPETPNIS